METEILSKIGVGSGLNTKEIITAIVNAETVSEKQRIESDKTEYETKISALGILKSEITIIYLF